MKKPLPIRFAEYVMAKLRYPATTAGSLAFAFLFPIYFLLGADGVAANPVVFDNELEATGFFIIVSVIPSYFLMCFIAGIRLSNVSFEYFARQIETALVEKISQQKKSLGGYWPWAVLAGTLVANVNVETSALVFDPSRTGFLESIFIVSGNFIIWIGSTVIVFLFYLEGRAFHQIGKQIDIDLYDLDKLNGFGRASLAGFLLVMGALALSTLQSLDQDFSFGSYRQALAIGVPSAIALTLIPSWSIHRRLKRAKKRHLEEINTEISLQSNALDEASLSRMNSLLARRAIVSGFRTWPMDFSILSRFVLYVFIPPLAWTGAALMEIFLDAVLAG